MSNIFESMFSREPEQILCGDYYFKNPDIPGFDNAYIETIGIGTDPQEAQEKCKDKLKQMFLSNFNRSNVAFEYDEKNDPRYKRFLQGKEADKRITDIFREIAAKETPFMDLGSYHMGLAPYILHLNPKTPCLITNSNKNYISILSSHTKEKTEEYNTRFASFDEINIPLKRQSLDVVTGDLPLSGAVQNRLVDGRVMSPDEARKWCTITILMEVYRVLKPGGYFIFSEFSSNMSFEWKELEEYFTKHDKLYGMYSREELYESLKRHKESEKYCLNDNMIKAVGFDIEVKDAYSFKDPLENMPGWFYLEEFPQKTREFIPEDDIIDLEFTDFLYVLRKSE